MVGSAMVTFMNRAYRYLPVIPLILQALNLMSDIASSTLFEAMITTSSPRTLILVRHFCCR